MARLEPAAFCLQSIQHQAACYAAKTQVGGEPLGVAARPTWVTRSTHHQFRSLLDRLDLAVTVVTAGALHSPCQHADCLITGEHAGMRSPTAMRGRPTGAVASERTPLACLPRSKVVQWAWLDLNQRPHPYQLNAGNRCADHRFPRSPPTVGAQGMRSIGPLVCVQPSWRRPALAGGLTRRWYPCGDGWPAEWVCGWPICGPDRCRRGFRGPGSPAPTPRVSR
jgi:hypothetical protein